MSEREPEEAREFEAETSGALAQRVDRMGAELVALRSRVAALEAGSPSATGATEPSSSPAQRLARRLAGRPAAPTERSRAPQPAVAEAAITEPQGAEPTIAQPTIAQPTIAQPTIARPTAAARAAEPPVAAQVPRPALRALLPGVTRDRLPVLAMAAAGGLALLVGLLYLAWHSIREGWVPPEVRVTLVGGLGLAAIAGGWLAGGRGHRSLAGGLAGAGLGAWFGAVLVARHAHAFIGPAATLGLLALGALVGFGVAAHRRVRWLASLALVGAVLTPLAVGRGGHAPAEAMVYQCVVLLLAFGFERRRGWSEVGHLAFAGAWVLLGDVLLGGARWPVVGWSFALVALGHGSAALVLGARRPWHAALRLAGGGGLAWMLAGVAAADLDRTATVGIGMAAVNGLFALWFARGRTVGARAGDAAARRLALPLVGLAWLQLYAWFPAAFDGSRVHLGWTAMAIGAAIVFLRRRDARSFAPIVLPWASAVVGNWEEAGGVAVALGFGLAALPAVVALAPRGRELAERSGLADALFGALLPLAAVLWLATSARFIDVEPRSAAIAHACFAALLAGTVRAVRSPSPVRVGVAVGLQVASIPLFLALGAGAGLLAGSRPLGGEAAAFVLALAGLAGLGRWTARAAAGRVAASGYRGAHAAAELAVPAALVADAMFLTSGAAASFAPSARTAESIHQVSWSVLWAAVGLGLLVRGLSTRRRWWRTAGFGLLALTGAKLVLVELTLVPMAWRVVSFVGLGACLLAGAFWYVRLGQSPDGPGEGPGEAAAPPGEGETAKGR